MAPSSAAGPFQLVVPMSKRRASSSQALSDASEGPKKLKQRKAHKLPKQPVASSSRVLVEDSRAASSQPRQASTKLKQKGSAASQPKKQPTASPVRQDKHALWIELDSDEDSDEGGGDVKPKNIVPARRRSSTAQAAPEPGPSSRKRARRSSTKLDSAAPRSSAAAPSPRGSLVKPRKRQQMVIVFPKEASDSQSSEEEEESKAKEPSPELAAPVDELPVQKAVDKKQEKLVKSEEPYLPPRQEITHDFYIDIPLRRKKPRPLPPTRASNKIKGKANGPPGRKASAGKKSPPSENEDSDDDAISVVSRPSTSRADSSGPPPAKKRKVDSARAPPSPSMSPASHRPRLPHVLRRPSPLAQRQPSPSPTPPPAQPTGALVDRPPPPPPSLPRRALNPAYEPAVRFGAFVAGTFPPPSPPVSTVSLISATGAPGGKGKKRAVSADPLLLEGIKMGPLSTSSTSSAPPAALLPRSREETSSGRTSIEASPALPPSPPRLSSAPVLPAPNANLRRTGRATIQALPPSAVALRASTTITASTFQSLPLTRPPRPDDPRKIIAKRWAFLKQHHGVGDNAHLSFEDNWRREDGVRNIREKRGQEKWKGVKSRQWWKEERERELFDEEQAGSGAEDEEGEEEKGWQYATEMEVVPWEWDGVDLGRGRAWNDGEGMNPGWEEHGRRWAVCDPGSASEGEEEESEEERPVVSMEAIRAAMDVDTIIAETDDEDSDSCVVVTPAAVIPPTIIPSTTIVPATSTAPHQPVARVLPPQGRALTTIIAPMPAPAPHQPVARPVAPPAVGAPSTSTPSQQPATRAPPPHVQASSSGSRPSHPPSQSAPRHFHPPHQHGHAALQFPPHSQAVPPFPYYHHPPYSYPPPAPFPGYYPPPPPPPGYYHHFPPPPPHHYPYPAPYPYHPPPPPQHAPRPALQQARSSSSTSSRQGPPSAPQPQQASSAPPLDRNAGPAPPPASHESQRADEAVWARSISESGSAKSAPPKPVSKAPSFPVQSSSTHQPVNAGPPPSQPSVASTSADRSSFPSVNGSTAPVAPSPTIIRPTSSPPRAKPPTGPFSRPSPTKSAPSSTPKPSPLGDSLAAAAVGLSPISTSTSSAASAPTPIPIVASTCAPSPVVPTTVATNGPAPSTATNGKAISIDSDSSNDSEDSEEVARSLRKESTAEKEGSAEMGSPKGKQREEDGEKEKRLEKRQSMGGKKEVEVLVLSD